LTDTFPALALAVEPGEADVMRQPPRDPKAQILFPAMLRQVGIYGALIAGCTLAAYAWGLTASGDAARASTLAFLTLAYGQIFHLGNARGDWPAVAQFAQQFAGLLTGDRDRQPRGIPVAAGSPKSDLDELC
jgi:magnesium-transporting ATPase (P-type)